MAEGLADLLTVDSPAWVALDTETTGLGPWDEVLEVAVVAASGELLFESLVKPSRPIPAKASAIHGLHREDLMSAPPWPLLWPQLEALLRGHDVLAWNAAFDLRLIRQSCSRYGLSMQAPRFLCLQQVFKQENPFIRASLDAACLALGVPRRPAHRARPDAEVVRLIALAMLDEA